jgi:hypothetical protein
MSFEPVEMDLGGVPLVIGWGEWGHQVAGEGVLG